MNDNANPLENLLADKKKNLRKFKSLDAYIAHLKALPSPDELLKQLEAKAGKKAEPIRYALLDINSDKANDPLEEIRANKRAIRKQYKTLDTYLEHMKTIPPVDESSCQVRAKIKTPTSAAQKTARKAKGKSHVRTKV